MVTGTRFASETFTAFMFNSSTVSCALHLYSNATRVRLTLNGVVRARPRHLPDAVARCSPASTQSLAMTHSNSENTPNMTALTAARPEQSN